MANELTIFDQPKTALPAHVAKFFQSESNIADRVSVPSLGVTGKVWTIAVNGEKTKLMRKDAEGDESPVAVFRAVVLDYAKKRGRAYYEGAYDPDKEAAPACWSDDGVAPDTSIAEPKASKCADCPMSVKGSKITDNGKSVVACSQHRMIAIVPANKLDFPALRLKLAITSLWDKTSTDLAAQNWFAFDNYTDFIKAKGGQHTAAFVTKMKFDPNVAYPKVIFSPDRWLTDDELKVVAERLKGDEVPKLLEGTWTPAGVDGTPVQPSGKEQTSADIPDEDAQAKALQAQAEAVRAERAATAAKTKAAAEAKAQAEAAAAAAAVAGDDDDDVEIILPGASAPKADTAKPVETKADKPAAETKVSKDVPEDLKALLAGWDED